MLYLAAMRMLMTVVGLLGLLLAAGCANAPATKGEPSTAAQPDVRPLRLDDVRSATIERGHFAREELLSLAPLLREYALVGPSSHLDISRLHGSLQTRVGEYELFLRREKVASRTYLLELRPRGEPAGRESLRMRFEREPGRALMRRLRDMLGQPGRERQQQVAGAWFDWLR